MCSDAPNEQVLVSAIITDRGVEVVDIDSLTSGLRATDAPEGDAPSLHWLTRT
jgi:hypothetical protein